MYKFALCDDIPQELQKLDTLLTTYKQIHTEREFTIHPFISMEALLMDIELNAEFDLLLLDIFLPKKSGIDAAKELRKNGYACPIIFLTTSKDFALEAFSVQAIQYLLKPVSQQDFFSALDYAFLYMNEKKLKYLNVKSDGEIKRIAFRDILFVEARGNYQYLSLWDGNIIRVRMTSAEMYEELGQYSCFVRSGASFIVNLSHISGINAKEIILVNGAKIPVPRGAYAALREQYFSYYCER